MIRCARRLAGLLFCFLALPAIAADLFPRDGLDAARSYARERAGLCLLVEHRGRMIVEDYYNGCGPRRDYNVFSITKSMWGLAAAAAAKDGLLKFDERVSDTLPEWNDRARRDITIRQLLSMTSGLNPGFRQIYGDGVVDKNAAALRLPLRAAPGRIFDYGPGSIEVFSELFHRKLLRHGASPQEYLQRHLLGPARMSVLDDRRDELGHVMFSSGFHLRPVDLLHLGSFVLGLRRSASHAELFRGTRANPAYGLTFWLNEPASRSGREVDIEQALDKWPAGSQLWSRICLAESAPPDMIAMIGSRNQRVYVVPSMDLVIVRMGFGKEFRDGEFWRRLRHGMDIGG